MCRVEPVAGTGGKAELRIWLLGEFRVVVGGHEVPAAAWHRSKARSLVKLLALAPAHRLHREQLMDALWPDLTPEAAAANLRKAIHFVRRAMGTGAVRVSNEVVRLDATPKDGQNNPVPAVCHAAGVQWALSGPCTLMGNTTGFIPNLRADAAGICIATATVGTAPPGSLQLTVVP